MSATLLREWNVLKPLRFEFGAHQWPEVQEEIHRQSATWKKRALLLLITAVVLTVFTLTVTYLVEYYIVRGDVWMISEMVLLALVPLLWIACWRVHVVAYRVAQLNTITTGLSQLRLQAGDKIEIGFNLYTVETPDYREPGKKERDCFAFFSLDRNGEKQLITFSVLLWSKTTEKPQYVNTPQQRTRPVSENKYQLWMHGFKMEKAQEKVFTPGNDQKTFVLTSELVQLCTAEQGFETSGKKRPPFAAEQVMEFAVENMPGFKQTS